MSKKIKKIIQYVLSLLLGAGAAQCAVPFAIKTFGDDSVLLFELKLFAALIPVLLVGIIMIAAHEAGHLIAGLMSGYKFVSFRVMSFTLIKVNGKLRLRRFSLAGTAGQCLLKPPAWTEKGIPVRLYNLGGILMNAVLMLVSAAGAFFVPADTFPGMLLLASALLNGFFVITNGLPLENNDGDNVLHLSRDLAAQRAFWTQMAGNAMMAEGLPLEDIPDDFYSVGENADMSNPLICASAASHAQLLIIKGRHEEGERECRRLIHEKKMPPVLSFLLANECLALELMRENREEAVKRLHTNTFEKFRKAMRNFPDVIRVQYIEALAGGDRAAAEKHRQHMEKVAKSYPYPQEIKTAFTLMNMADERFGGRQ